MRFDPTALPGVMVITIEPHEDARGFFARAFCEDEFARAGIALRPRQINLSHNDKALTLRGLHYQTPPHAEIKLVQCVRGRVFDVAVDLRSDSPAYRRWFGLELAPELRRMLLVPEGCAHGYLTLQDDSDVFYLVSAPFAPEAQAGVRWDDPAFGIAWPARPTLLSPRDQAFADFAPDGPAPSDLGRN
jgi:dTDP-4-dehydrorhamnose 3,5-epimerase